MRRRSCHRKPWPRRRISVAHWPKRLWQNRQNSKIPKKLLESQLVARRPERRPRLANVAALKEAGIDHKWVLTEGKHAWPIWRGYLGDFAPLLFR